MNTIFYDHDLPSERDPSRGSLRSKAKQLEWQEASLISQDIDDGGLLVSEIMGKSWRVGFFHANDRVWWKLFMAASKEQVLVRVSTQGFNPCSLESTEPLALRLLPRIDLVGVAEFGSINAALCDLGSTRELAKGYVGKRLRAFFAFGRRDVAAALWIYGVGWLIHRLSCEKSGGGSLGGPLVVSTTAEKFLTRAGWRGDLKGLEQVTCPPIHKVFSEEIREGRSLADHLTTELGLETSPSWASAISNAIADGEDPDIHEMTAALEELTHELRIAVKP